MYLASSGKITSTVGKPISYFLSTYKKFTPFATQFITNEVDQNQIGFGKSVRLTVPRKGDLVKTIFLKMTIRPPSQARNGTQPITPIISCKRKTLPTLPEAEALCLHASALTTLTSCQTLPSTPLL